VSVLSWIILTGLAMSALALVGSAALLMPDRLFTRVVTPLVALAAGALLGGALFHMACRCSVFAPFTTARRPGRRAGTERRRRSRAPQRLCC
jgi:hypothetical protein